VSSFGRTVMLGTDPASGSAVRRLLLGTLAVLLTAQPAGAYSVLAHEAVVDTAWDSTIRPLLLRRFPRTTADGLIEAHSYAYGGSVIQTWHYPFGNKFSVTCCTTRAGRFCRNDDSRLHDVNERIRTWCAGSLRHRHDWASGGGESIGAADLFRSSRRSLATRSPTWKRRSST
jgi:hypothetical protein